MFIKYRNFELISKDKMDTSSVLDEYVLRGSIERVIKIPFMDEQVKTINIFMDSMFWKYEKNGQYVCDAIKNQVNLWEVNNKQKLRTY